MPVTQNADVPCTHMSLMTSDITVQSDASRMRMSPNEIPPIFLPMFIAIIPQKPTVAPIILYTLNFSVLMNKNAKQAYKSGPSCFKIAAFEPFVFARPI